MSKTPSSTVAGRRGALRVAATVAAVLMLGACAGEEPAEDAAGEQDGGAAGTQIEIVDFAFEPSDVEVTPGTQVEWTNTGDVQHTVTFDDGEDSGNLDSGATYSRTFDEPGDYPYVCTIHPQMTATVTVAE